jgi:hypothetical protein
MSKLRHMLRSLHEGVVNAPLHQHAAKGRRSVRDPLSESDHVGHDALAHGGKGVAEPPEAGDHLVEDEEDAVGWVISRRRSR